MKRKEIGMLGLIATVIAAIGVTSAFAIDQDTSGVTSRAYGFVESAISAARQYSKETSDLSKVAMEMDRYLESASVLIASEPSAFGDALAAQTTRIACESRPRIDLLGAAMLLHLTHSHLETLNAIDCLVGAGNIEDPVVWRALDAWRVSGLRKTPTMLKLARTARDERTQHRLMTREEFVEFTLAATATNIPKFRPLERNPGELQ